MRVTYSTAAERAARTRHGDREAAVVWELAGLGLAAAAILIGVLLLYRAQSGALREADQALASGTLIDLNASVSAETLMPALLPVFAEPAERRFVADRIEAYTLGVDTPLGARRRLVSVGELGRLTVPLSTVRANRRLTSLRSRIGLDTDAAAESRSKAAAASDQGVAVPLFTTAQVVAIKPALIVRTPASYRWSLLVALALLVLPFFGAHAISRLRRAPADPFILPLVLLLCGVGVLAMLGLRDPLRDLPLFARFAQGVAAGCVVMVAARQLDLQRSPLRRLSYVPLAAAILLSAALILFGSGPGASDAKVNLLGVQPVEAIRLLVVLFYAGYFANRWEFLRELEEPAAARFPVLRGFSVPRLDYVLPVVAGVALVLVFFFLQKDLGPALVLACVFLALYGVARRRIPMVLAGFALLFAGFYAGYWLGVPRAVGDRVAMWRSPFDNAVRGGDQVAHALWALASGGFGGSGLGRGSPGLVPAAHTDLVLAAIGEELGFLGLLAVVGLTALLIHRAFRIALRAPGDYTLFLSLGLAVSFALQFLLIASGLLGLLPLTGVVTPFLSYGRSAMLANFAALGLLLGASERSTASRGSAEFARPVLWLGATLAVLGLAIVARVTEVQVLRADQYVAAPALSVQADGGRRFSYNPRLLEVAGDIVRGTIFDRRGVPLATSRPEVLATANEALTRLGVDPARACPNQDQRCYLFGGLTYHLLGDWRTQRDWAAANTSFVERDSDARLRGWDDHPFIVEVRDPRTKATTRVLRRSLSELVPLFRHRGDLSHPSVKAILERPRDLTLTVDIRLQQSVARILQQRIARAGRERGAVVVMSASGDLLASVSYPWPDVTSPAPSTSVRAGQAPAPEDGPWFDRARYGVYQPGSSFKIVTAAATLRSRPELAHQTVTCERLPDGRVGAKLPGWARPVRDDPADKAPHGTIAMDRALVVSCNGYFANLGLRLGAPALAETARLFEIPLGMPESPQQLRDTLPFAAYGQGQVLATPFKMARVAATMAAGGAMPQGRWVLDQGDSRTDPAKRVLTPAQAAELGRMMRQVVTGGTGRVLSGVDPPIAGKTGTAEVQGKPSHSWFVGFAPHGGEGSAIAFAVLVEHGGYGANLAAPIAGEVVRAARELGLVGL